MSNPSVPAESTPIEAQSTFGRIRLTPGVKRHHMTTYYYAALVAILMATFVPQAQPLILTEFLGIPESQQGVVSGNLSFWAEVVIILSVGVYGSLSDKIGRRPIFAAGFLFIGIGLALYPQAETISELLIYRLIFALGAAATTGMLSTVIADYAIDADRGRASGIQGVMNGLGALITVFLLLRLPKIFRDGGMDALSAGQTTYWIVAAVAVITAVVLMFGLQGRTKIQSEQKKNLLQIAQEGFMAARDPGVALAYGAAFVSRGDLAIVGTFFALWVTNYGTEIAGLSSEDALARAGMIVGISQTFALISAPIFGILTDRLNRVNALIVAVGISAVGYSSTFFVTDPLGTGMIISAVLIGMGEVGGVITSGVLIAQQAPRDIRGSVIGFFTFCGAIGILVASKVGGMLFDSWREAGPFVLFGFFGMLVVIWGLAVRNRIVPLNEQDVFAGGH